MGIIIFSKLSLPKMSHKTEINLQLKKKKNVKLFLNVKWVFVCKVI